jgi:hypothetical protein
VLTDDKIGEIKVDIKINNKPKHDRPASVAILAQGQTPPGVFVRHM